MSAQQTLIGMQGEPNYNSLEAPVVQRLKHYFNDPNARPLLTIDEDDLLIESDAIYFSAVAHGSVPRNAVQRIRAGELTNEDIVKKQKAGEAIVRGEKADMFAERFMSAAFALDSCRSLYRAIKKDTLIPVIEDDTLDTIQHRVGDYVADLLRAGRETTIIDQRLLRGPAMLRVTHTLQDKFVADPAVTLDLTNLAAHNNTRKLSLWLDQLHAASRNFDRITSPTRTKLMGYLASRPEEYMEQPDLFSMIAKKVG